MTLEELIFSAIKQHPGIKARELANLTGVDKTIINAVIYKSLLKRLRKDGAFRWYVADDCGSLAKPDDISTALPLSGTAIRRQEAIVTNALPPLAQHPQPSVSSSNRCQRCGIEDAKKGERFCSACRKVVLSQLDEAGYLAKKEFGHSGKYRSQEMRENVFETKHGTGHG